MEDLNAVLIFLKVAELESFVAAARALELPKSTVSFKVNTLEQQLGVMLFHRTTRRISLTEEGRLYYENCLPIVDALRDGKDAIASIQGKPQGTLQVTASVLFVQQFLAPILPNFLQTYPDLRVVLDAANSCKDLVQEGYDLAIRVGSLQDSTLVMYHMGKVRLKLIASPKYLQRYGKPTKIITLRDHSLLGSTPIQNEITWTLENDRGNSETIRFRPRLICNDMTPVYQAVKAGLGIGLLPEFLCQSELVKGNLVRVLPKWSSAPVQINCIYPSHKYLPQKVRVFLEFLKEKIQSWNIEI